MAAGAQERSLRNANIMPDRNRLRLRIHASSPIQELSPTSSFHGQKDAHTVT